MWGARYSTYRKGDFILSDLLYRRKQWFTNMQSCQKWQSVLSSCWIESRHFLIWFFHPTRIELSSALVVLSTLREMFDSSSHDSRVTSWSTSSTIQLLLDHIKIREQHSVLHYCWIESRCFFIWFFHLTRKELPLVFSYCGFCLLHERCLTVHLISHGLQANLPLQHETVAFVMII